MAPINVRGNTLDPDAAGKIKLPLDASGTDHVLVQTKTEMDLRTLAALENLGAKVVKRMEGNTWLLHYLPSDLSKLEAIDAVQHALVYLDHFKISADLKSSDSSISTVDERRVAIVLHEQSRTSLDQLVAEVQKFAIPNSLQAHERLIHLMVDRQHLEEIAKHAAVQAIEEEAPIALHNDRIRVITGVIAANNNLSDTQKLSGKGQVVAVADTGVDSTHPAFTGKIVAKYSHTKSKQSIDEDGNGHGTHVAGTVLGAPLKIGDQEILGVAPDAKLIVQALPIGTSDDIFTSILFNELYSNLDVTCRIHNNSWGPLMNEFNPVQLPYSAKDAEIIDEYLLDKPDLLVIWSAGNDGSVATMNALDKAQIGSFAAAKNVLTVGATYSDRPSSSGPGPQFLDKVDFSPEARKVWKLKRGQVAHFSSRGPVLLTKRTKPDLVAPGVCILSARTNSVVAHNNIKKWIEQFGAPRVNNKDEYTDDMKFVYCSGTSMAAPAVAGCAALLRQAFQDWHNMKAPSAPLMKAALINGTDDLGVGSNMQGFGQINMTRVLSPLLKQGSGTSGFSEYKNTKNDLRSFEWKSTVPKSTTGKNVHFQVTLAYHDAKGDVIQNYMYLSVTHKKQLMTNFDPTDPNNVHRVILKNLTPGDEILFKVEPKKLLIGDALPWGLAWDYFEA